jgi:hypothetical protein
MGGRGVRAQHKFAVRGVGVAVTAPDEEGVHHRTGRMVGVHVQRVEVEPFGLDLGTLRHLVAHGHEVILDAFLNGGQRMARSGRTTVVGQGDVDGLLDEDGPVALLLEFGATRLVVVADLPPGPVDPLARLGAGRRWQRRDLPVGQRQRTPVTDVGDEDVVQGGQIRGAGDRGQRRGHRGGDILLGQDRYPFGVVHIVGPGHGQRRSKLKSLCGCSRSLSTAP